MNRFVWREIIAARPELWGYARSGAFGEEAKVASEEMSSGMGTGALIAGGVILSAVVICLILKLLGLITW